MAAGAVPAAVPPLGSLLPITGTDLAAVMFTSGSTGTPKGAAIPHRAIVRLILGADYAALTPADTVVFASNPAFDAVTFEVWGPLLTGGTLLGLERDALLSSVSLGRRLTELGATAMFVPTGLFHMHARLAPDAFRSLRHLLIGGEALSPAAVRAVLAAGPPRNLRNVYGPTEATTFSTTHDAGTLPADADAVPIGRPVANSRAYLLDDERRPVPVGEPGELFLGGPGVALGYHREPALTAERFSADPWLPGERLYRTGDFAVWTPEHALEYRGRRDDQVKVRGFRIELGEVEAAVRALPGVAEAAVVVRGEGAGRMLAAYVVPRHQGADPTVEIKARLAAVLPVHMVPGAIHCVERLPLTSNGKVDRRAVGAEGAR
jgi:amino acid adenylation domain-containing protein